MASLPLPDKEPEQGGRLMASINPVGHRLIIPSVIPKKSTENKPQQCLYFGVWMPS